MEHKYFRSALVWIAGAVFLLATLVGLEWIFSWKTVSITSPLEEAFSSGSVDGYVRNLSQSGSSYGKATAYGKGELLELVYFITPESTLSFIANFAKLKEGLDVQSVLVDEREAPIATLDAPLNWTGTTIVKIRGRAKQPSGMEWSNLADDLISVEFSGKKPITPRLPKPVVNEEEDNHWLAVENAEFTANENTVVKIVWKSEILGKIRYVNIGGKSFPVILRNESAYVVLERWNFAKGDYFVGAYLDNWELVPVEGKVSFSADPKPVSISTIVPNRASSERDTYVVLQGNGFSKIISIQLSNSLIFKNASFSITSDQVAIVKIPKGLASGTYRFNLMDTKGIYSTDTTELTVY